MNQDINVLCMKWGTKYPSSYVNRLYVSVRKHLSYPFRFVCFTDDTTGINPAIECLPLPEFKTPEGDDRGWPKLSMFNSPLFDLKGVGLFLDIDIIIVGQLEPFFDIDGDFLIIKDWKRPWRITGNSSVFRFKINETPQIVSNFIQNQKSIQKRYRNEQEYLSAYMHENRQLLYWPSNWCQSFKANLIPKFPLNFFKTPVPSKDTRIVIFHGSPKPEEALLGKSSKWYRFFKPAPWIASAWVDLDSTDSSL